MIISHGDGYMSLYGHNQALYRETGEWVTAGDVIATVGDSGGQNQAGLYFEIRIAGKPSDPQRWCVAREQSAA
jgi:septal ring factor EnvC (AmiA/AmiB activator)